MKKIILLVLCLASFAVNAFEPFVVEDIRIIGADRISQGTIFSHLPMERGDEIDAQMVRNGIQGLFSTGYFSDIKMSRDGQVLIITVEERPAIATISISGNKSIKTEELLVGLENIGLAEGEVF
jgi:outer membrane protein insertion porin family